MKLTPGHSTQMDMFCLTTDATKLLNPVIKFVENYFQKFDCFENENTNSDFVKWFRFLRSIQPIF